MSASPENLSRSLGDPALLWPDAMTHLTMESTPIEHVWHYLTSRWDKEAHLHDVVGYMPDLASAAKTQGISPADLADILIVDIRFVMSIAYGFSCLSVADALLLCREQCWPLSVFFRRGDVLHGRTLLAKELGLI